MLAKVFVVNFIVGFFVFCGFRPSVGEKIQNEQCSLSVWSQSISYFDSVLSSITPHFVHFRLEFERSTHYKTTANVLKPLHWVWTYKSHSSIYPYISWNIDYGILSFGLLDSYTTDIGFVKIISDGSCNLTLGEYNTSMMIAGALTDLFNNFSTGSFNAYDSNDFCYLSFDENVTKTWAYFASIYFNYPSTYFGYTCCHVEYNYTESKYDHFCDTTLQSKWEQSTFMPYWLGLFLFMYCPILLFQVSAWLVKDDFDTKHCELRSVNDEGYQPIDNQNGKWVFLNGDTPIGITSLVQAILCNLSTRNPVVMSRIRRTIAILLTPTIIYIQLAMYQNGIRQIQVSDLVKRGVPMGFLSLLGEKEDRNKVFAPVFGGALCLLIMFYLQSFIFLVAPRSLNLIVERGMPVRNFQSPLCLDAEEIISMSMCRIFPAPGYEKGYAVCKCSIYMLFTKAFWEKVYDIQSSRFYPCFKFIQKCKIIGLVIIPFYIIFCFLEIVACLLFYGIPVFGFVTIIVKGGVKSLSRIGHIMTVFSHPIIVVFCSFVIFTMLVFFVYSVGLIFIESFSFICQIITYCFIAVIVYPSIAFGYLFFVIVMLYYIVRRIKDFGDGYLGLLSLAVEKSQDLFMHINNITIFNGELIISNVSLKTVKTIRINDIRLDIAENTLNRLKRESVTEKVRKVDSTYGIPLSLFDYLVKKHRPVHIQVLKLVWHLAAVVLLVCATLGITSKVATGKNNEISEVMHVIFIVTVGALPQILEVALTNAKESVVRDVEQREIENSILEYWNMESDNASMDQVDQ